MMLRSHCSCFSWILQSICSEGNPMCKFLNWVKPLSPWISHPSIWTSQIPGRSIPGCGHSEMFVHVVIAVSYRSWLKGHTGWFSEDFETPSSSSLGDLCKSGTNQISNSSIKYPDPLQQGQLWGLPCALFINSLEDLQSLLFERGSYKNSACSFSSGINNL